MFLIKSDTEDAIQHRLNTAKEEMEYFKTPGACDHVVINDDLEISYQHLKGLLIKVCRYFLNHDNLKASCLYLVHRTSTMTGWFSKFFHLNFTLCTSRKQCNCM